MEGIRKNKRERREGKAANGRERRREGSINDRHSSLQRREGLPTSSGHSTPQESQGKRRGYERLIFRPFLRRSLLLISSENQSAEKVKYELNENKISDTACPFKMAATGFTERGLWRPLRSVCLSGEVGFRPFPRHAVSICLACWLLAHQLPQFVRLINSRRRGAATARIIERALLFVMVSPPPPSPPPLMLLNVEGKERLCYNVRVNGIFRRPRVWYLVTPPSFSPQDYSEKVATALPRAGLLSGSPELRRFYFLLIFLRYQMEG